MWLYEGQCIVDTGSCRIYSSDRESAYEQRAACYISGARTFSWGWDLDHNDKSPGPVACPLLSAPVAGRGHDGAYQEPELVCVDQGTSDLRWRTLGLVRRDDAVSILVSIPFPTRASH